ncbi:MAG: molybdopterin converting factor subunit 1 [Aquificaceae bacterium]
MKVKYFAVVRERLKKEEEELDFKGTVAQLRQLLIEKYPELEPVLKVSLFAVDEEYVEEDYVIKGEERVVLIPPVSGG